MINTFYSYVKKIKLTPNQRTETDLVISAESDFLVEKVYAIFQNPFKIQISDTTSNFNWFSDRIRSDSWFGTPQYPNELPKPIEILRNTIIKFDIENLSNTSNDIEIVFEGYKIFNPIKPSKEKYYCYVQDVFINPLDISTYFLKTNADADFLLFKLYKYSDNDYNVMIKIAASNYGGRMFSNEYINVDNIFGTVLRPNILKHPIKIDKNSIIQIETMNKSNNNEYLQLVFDGIRKFE